MTWLTRLGADNIDAVKSDGVVTSANKVGASTTFGCTLGVGTYYFIIGASDTAVAGETWLVSAHLKWAAAVAATITVETSNFPLHVGGDNIGPFDTHGYSTTVGDWIQENPSTAIVAVTGSGNSSTAATVTAGGSAAGGATFHLGNIGTRRVRIKIVTTVGGLVRCGIHGKE